MHPELAGVTSWATTVVFGTLAIGFELRTRHIPNWLTLGGLIPAIAIAALTGRLADALLGFALAAVVGVFMFMQNGLAGGGVKTAALLGLCAGYAGGLALAATGLVAYAIGKAWSRWRPASLQDTVPSTPFALAVTLGGMGVAHVLAA